MAKTMALSFVRRRVRIQPTCPLTDQKWDLILLAGPTWSYNPSGPVLDFLDRYGKAILKNTQVVPLISCRSYWRTHYWGLKRILQHNGATVLRPMVFLHSAAEPWRTMGLFLQLMGRLPRLESSWFRRRYPKYGHSREQYVDALEMGRRIARSLQEDNER
jgi:multimeric flavodoxin WrbA